MPLNLPHDPIVAAALASAALDSGVPSDVVHAVAWVESRFHPRALSPVGAMGLMQLMPKTALGLGVTDPYNPLQNAAGGARFLKELYVQFGGDLATIDKPSPAWELALGAYNWGPGNVKKNSDPLRWPESVRQYVVDVWRQAGWPLPFEVETRQIRKKDLPPSSRRRG